MEMIGIGIAGGLALATGLIGYIEARRASKTSQLVDHLKQYEPLFLNDRWTRVVYQIETIGEKAPRWQRATLLVTHKRVALYPYVPNQPDKVKALYTIQPDELRGFWRPIKYMSGQNTIWLHAEISGRWQILKLKLYQYDMQELVRALKEISTPEQVTAYRRRRPYIHRGPIHAHPAHQTLTGAWEIGTAIQLYLMPLYLVVMRDGRVRQQIELAQIQDIGALKRMEGGKPAGLIRFFVDNDLQAFALDDYEAWAQALAEASKRTLEEPVMRKRKAKDNGDALDDWDDLDE
ncbi:MAG: hypothetical protein ACFE0Q_00795 [Anaerolineae bacterium]